MASQLPLKHNNVHPGHLYYAFDNGAFPTPPAKVNGVLKADINVNVTYSLLVLRAAELALTF